MTMNMTNELKCAIYLPHERDAGLGEDEYYVLNNADEVRRVRLAALVRRAGYPRPVCETVGIRSGDRFINMLEQDGCFRFGQLYDNAEDCAARTHDDYDFWERLRLLQAADSGDKAKIIRAIKSCQKGIKISRVVIKTKDKEEEVYP